MSKQYLKSSWSQIAIGTAMLGCIVLAGLIRLSNTIGIGKALASVVLGVLIAAWVIVGVIFIVRGLNKM